MTKVKVQKCMNLHELIKYAWENKITNKTFYTKGHRPKSVKFWTYSQFGIDEGETRLFCEKDVFIVDDAEIEVDGDTLLPCLIAFYEREKDDYPLSERFKDTTINEIIKNNYNVATIYNLDAYGVQTLLWKK